jgi:Tfp pilus assembly protein PilF
VALADTLRRRLLRQIARQARQWETRDDEKAADWYEEALRIDPAAEDVGRTLASVYQRLGRPAAAEDVRIRMRSVMRPP